MWIHVTNVMELNPERDCGAESQAMEYIMFKYEHRAYMGAQDFKVKPNQ